MSAPLSSCNNLNTLPRRSLSLPISYSRTVQQIHDVKAPAIKMDPSMTIILYISMAMMIVVLMVAMIALFVNNRVDTVASMRPPGDDENPQSHNAATI